MTTVKQEGKKNNAPPQPQTAEDKELEQWAQGLVSRPTPQIGNNWVGGGGGGGGPGGVGLQQSTLNNFLGLTPAGTTQQGNNSSGTTNDQIPPNNGYTTIFFSIIYALLVSVKKSFD
jgi:hypothetical protein